MATIETYKADWTFVEKEGMPKETANFWVLRKDGTMEIDLFFKKIDEWRANRDTDIIAYTKVLTPNKPKV